MEALVKIIVHCKDLNSYPIGGLPERVQNIDDVSRDIMEHGAYSYQDKICFFIPPDNIATIEYHKGEVPDEAEDDDEG